jgi:tRNA (guanine6-N2)-methyltransferase
VPAEVDLDRPVEDVLVLDTVPGGVDHLAQELTDTAAGRAAIVRRGADFVVVRYAGPLRPLAAGRMYSRLSVLLSDRAGGDGWPDRLADSVSRGVLSAVHRSDPPLHFRVGPIGDLRWPVRDAIGASFGWVNDPGDWDANVEERAGLLRAEVGPLFLTARFGELQRLPASTTPVIAAIMCRLAKIQAGDLVLDPMCGAGTLLVVAAAYEPRLTVGTDLDAVAVKAAAANVAARGVPALILRADARHLPLPAGSVDRVVSNLPFGKRVGSHDENVRLYPAMLRELTRVLTRQGRAALLTEDKRVFREAVQRTPRLHLVRELVVESGGAHPSIYVLARTRGRR